MYEFQAWLQAEMLKPNAQVSTVLTQFIARFGGILRDWWITLQEYRQNLFIQMPDINQALYLLYDEFCGLPHLYENQVREEYFKMRCCSLKKKDLDRHYKEMVKRYHIFRGMDDPNMKQAFLASIPESLSHEATKLM